MKHQAALWSLQSQVVLCQKHATNSSLVHMSHVRQFVLWTCQMCIAGYWLWLINLSSWKMLIMSFWGRKKTDCCRIYPECLSRLKVIGTKWLCLSHLSRKLAGCTARCFSHFFSFCGSPIYHTFHLLSQVNSVRNVDHTFLWKSDLAVKVCPKLFVIPIIKPLTV